MRVSATLSAPASAYRKLTKPVCSIDGVNWKSADFLCGSCGYANSGHADYVADLERQRDQLLALVAELRGAE